MTQAKSQKTFSAAALVAAAFFTGGCGGERVVAPSDAKLSVRASPTSGAVGEPIEIVALVTAGTKPVRRGTIVEFSVTPTTAAEISPGEAETDANGEARAVLIGSVSGSVTVAVASGSAESKTLAVTITEPGSLALSLESERTRMSVNGQESRLTVRADAATDGVQVNFAVQGVQGGTVSDPVVTLQGGVAYTTFTTDRSNFGTATIVAHGPGRTQDDVNIEIVNEVARVDLVADKTSLVAADFPNGLDVTFTASPIGLARDARMSGLPVAFTKTLGEFATTPSPTTNGSGDATVKLTLTKAELDQAKAGSPITVTVTAKAEFGDAKTNSLTLTVN